MRDRKQRDMVVFTQTNEKGQLTVNFYDVTLERVIVRVYHVASLLYISPPEAHALPDALHWCLFDKKGCNIDFDKARE